MGRPAQRSTARFSGSAPILEQLAITGNKESALASNEIYPKAVSLGQIIQYLQLFECMVQRYSSLNW